MKPANTLFSTLTQVNKLSETTLTRNNRKPQPKLSMIWVKEFDGKGAQLVARWVTQD